MEQTKKVGLYVRVSSTEQSVGMQEDELLEYAKSRGWSVFRVYKDSATGTNDKRQALRDVMKDAKARRFDILAVWKLDRFFRSLKGMVLTLQELSDLGIEFVSLRDQIDLTTASGRLMLHLLSAFAEFEASLIRERVKAGIAHAKAKGKRMGRPPVRCDSQALNALISRGASIREAARRLGISPTSVSRRVSKTHANGDGVSQ